MKNNINSSINVPTLTKFWTSMDANNITMLFRYGSHVAVKIAFPTMKYDVLVDFVCRKWILWNFKELCLSIRSTRWANITSMKTMTFKRCSYCLEDMGSNKSKSKLISQKFQDKSRTSLTATTQVKRMSQDVHKIVLMTSG